MPTAVRYVLIALLAAGGVQSAPKKKGKRQQKTSEEKLLLKLRPVFSQTTQRLLTLADNPHGLIFPPLPATEPGAATTKARRYRRETIAVRTPLYILRDADLWRYSRRGGGDLQRVRHTSGGRTVKRTYLRLDPTGPVRREETRHAPDPENSKSVARWYPGFLGLNGLAIYALVRAGVVTMEPALRRHAASLIYHLQAYGLPHETWDLAWVTTGLCSWPERSEPLDRLRQRLAAKLLHAQVRNGAGKGLWGPVAEDAEVLLALAAAKAAEGRDARRRQHTVFTGDFNNAPAAWRLDPDPAAPRPEDFKTLLEQVEVPGPPVDWTAHQVTDLHHTALALTALAAAADCGCLPAESTPAAVGDTTPAPRLTREVVSAAAQAVRAAFNVETGTWTEAIHYAPETRYDALIKEKRARKRNRPRTVDTERVVSVGSPLVNAQALTALGALRRLLPADAGDATAVLLDQTTTLVRQDLKNYDSRRRNRKLPKYLGMSTNEYFLFAAAAHRRRAGYLQTDRAQFRATADRLARSSRGGNIGGDQFFTISPGAGAVHLAMEKAKKHNATRARNRRIQMQRRNAIPKALGSRAQTLSALAFLADGVRPPLGLACGPDGGKEVTFLPAAIRQLDRQQAFPLFAAAADTLPEFENPAGPSVIFINALAPPRVKGNLLTALQPFFAGDGLLVIETPATKQGKRAFDAIRAAARAELKDVRAARIPASTLTRAPARPDEPRLPALVTADHHIRVIFLITGDKPSKSVLATDTAAKLTADLLAQRLPDALTPDYPFNVRDKNDDDIIVIEE